MSKARLRDLQLALEGAGWMISRSDTSDPNDLFQIVDGIVEWQLLHLGKNLAIELSFPCYTGLGENSKDISDIIMGRVPRGELRIYFEKRNKEEWRQNIAAFIDELNRLKGEDAT